jgi:hypothetical protein
LEEGEMWDAVCCGIGAFKKKRAQQKKVSQEKKLTDKVMSAEGEELKALIKQIVADGYSVQSGKVKKPPRVKKMHKEMLECMITRTALA